MITYIEKGLGLHKAINAAGHWIEHRDNVWISSDDQAVQIIINSYNPLEDQKDIRIGSVKSEGLQRIHLVFPAVQSLDDLDLEVERWKSLTPAAKSPTTDYSKMINIHAAAKAAIISIKAATTKAQIDAVVVNWPI